MTPSEFCYWLQGQFELNEAGATPVKAFNEEQTRCIKDHLGYVFETIVQSEPLPAAKRPATLEEIDERIRRGVDRGPTRYC